MVEYRYLGRSALKVSPLTLGSMMFGNQTPDDVAFRIIDKAREQGINFIDTADVYHDGKSEEVVGRGIKANRDHWVVATKFVNSRAKGRTSGAIRANGSIRLSKTRCAISARTTSTSSTFIAPSSMRRSKSRCGRSPT